MTTLLENLQLEEVSLVDTPANQEALLTLFKRHQLEDIDKMTDEQDTKVKAYMKEKGCGKDEAMKALGDEMGKAEDNPTEELCVEVVSF